jgi:hypothetical protein
MSFLQGEEKLNYLDTFMFYVRYLLILGDYLTEIVIVKFVIDAREVEIKLQSNNVD